jgi:hypothetical protein
MKADTYKSIFTILFYVVFAFFLSGCKKETDERRSATESGTIEAGDATYNTGEGAVIDSTENSVSIGSQDHAISSHQATVKKTTTRMRKNEATSHNTKNKLSGYSAPNGTDAENHDGDPYTKNDTMHRPTGPPIK